MKTKQEIGKLFDDGLNCAQITLLEFCEKYGVEPKTALKVSCGFGGGMRCAEVCGAVTGGIMAVGIAYGMESAEEKEAKAVCYAKTAEYCAKFKDKNGSVVCRELLGCDISTPEGAEYAKANNLFRTTCVQMVGDAISILEEMGL